MPKSKRDKAVSLTKVVRKGKEAKSKLIDEIRSCVDLYERVFVFSVANMRNTKLKDVRMKWKDTSRFFFGKSKVMSLALGRIKQESVKDNLYKLSKHLYGQRGLFFTNAPSDDVISYFKQYCEIEFAKSGAVAPKTVLINAGPLDHQFSHSMEPQLRKLGLPTQIQRGIVALIHDYTICSEGEKLTPEQAKLLKLFGMKTVEFRINLLCFWNRDSTKFESLKKKEYGKNDKPSFDCVEIENSN